jgi:phosphatidylglycerol:prolipoprotein diacylglycerol transferase
VEPKLADVDSLNALISTARENPQVSQTLGNFLPPRHPSQVYEGLLEGALLFAILWVVRTRFPKAPDGLLTGMFFGFYALFRIVGEQFREPDAAMVGMLTKGQFFSMFMFLFAAVMFLHAWRGWRGSERRPDH